MRKLVVVPALHPDPATIDEGDRAYAIPFDFVGPASVVEWKLSGSGQHRTHPLGKRLEVRPRRIHAVDHTILSVGREEDIAPAHSRPVQHDHDLPWAPLFEFKRARIP